MERGTAQERSPDTPSGYVLWRNPLEIGAAMFRRILFASDGSPSAESAAVLAREMAACSGAEVVVLSVVQPITFGDFRPVLPELVDEADQLAHDEARRQVDRLIAAGIEARAVVEVSPSVDGAILGTAESVGADLIVMGTHGRSGLARAILGSVADRVLRSSPVPLLLARATAEDGQA